MKIKKPKTDEFSMKKINDEAVKISVSVMLMRRRGLCQAAMVLADSPGDEMAEALLHLAAEQFSSAKNHLRRVRAFSAMDEFIGDDF